MVGSFYLAKQYAIEDDFPDEDDSSWSYHYSFLPTIKGDILRASISYLSSLKKEAASRPDACQFFVDAGIKSVAELTNDQDVLAQGNKVIDAALHVLRRWVREPQGKPVLFMNTPSIENKNDLNLGPDSKFAKFLANTILLRDLTANKDTDGLLDSPLHLMNVMQHVHCPIELANAGMRGILPILQLSTGGAVYPDEAKLMAAVLERIIPTMADKDQKYKEYIESLRVMLSKCVDGFVIQG